MMLSSSAVDRALGIQTGNHFWQSQDARKPPRRRLGIRGWQCEVIDGHGYVAHHGGWKIVANVKRKPEIGRLSYDQKMEPMTKVTDVEDLRHPDTEKLLHTSDPARLAYNGRDGFPRVIPIGFWWNGTDIVVCTAPTAPKVKARGERPNVALTIDDCAAGEGAPGTRRREDRDRRRRCAGVPRGRGQVDERRPTRHI